MYLYRLWMKFRLTIKIRSNLLTDYFWNSISNWITKDNDRSIAKTVRGKIMASSCLFVTSKSHRKHWTEVVDFHPSYPFEGGWMKGCGRGERKPWPWFDASSGRPLKYYERFAPKCTLSTCKSTIWKLFIA